MAGSLIEGRVAATSGKLGVPTVSRSGRVFGGVRGVVGLIGLLSIVSCSGLLRIIGGGTLVAVGLGDDDFSLGAVLTSDDDVLDNVSAVKLSGFGHGVNENLGVGQVLHQLLEDSLHDSGFV